MISEDTTLVVVDIQEKLVSSIHKADEMILNAKKCILAAKVMGMPIVYTEQYPKGLGHTVSNLQEHLTDVPVFEKTSFSCCGDREFLNILKNKTVLLVGIEAHVCIYQTACDLMDNGYEVLIAEDAVSSRKEIDYRRAMSNLEKKGVFISTFECLFMKLLRDSKHPSFKDVSAVLKL
jgi:nicotinamidase-related amidase